MIGFVAVLAIVMCATPAFADVQVIDFDQPGVGAPSIITGIDRRQVFIRGLIGAAVAGVIAVFKKTLGS
jgi:hypothetical protein